MVASQQNICGLTKLLGKFVRTFRKTTRHYTFCLLPFAHLVFPSVQGFLAVQEVLEVHTGHI